jgi:hypothetical protein
MTTLEKDDTIPIMEYYKVDVLTSDQLMIDDLILVDEEVVSVVNIISLSDGYTLEVENDFGEREIIQIEEDDQFDLMMLQ